MFLELGKIIFISRECSGLPNILVEYLEHTVLKHTRFDNELRFY